MAARFRAVHTFWWVQGDINGQAADFILSAGPWPPGSSGVQYLDVFPTPGNDNGNGDNSKQHLVWSSGVSSTLCAQVDAMISAAKSFPNNTILYNAVGLLGLGGPNSNSVASYLGLVGGFAPVPPRTAYGWFSPIFFASSLAN
jgi:hypothetical protein